MKVEIVKQEIETRIFTIRGMQVMLDRDLAYFYQVTTKALNQAVKRNILRFPEDFMFQLTTIEKIELVTNCDRLEKLKHSTALSFVFTEHGVAMLSSVLRSEAALEINISIIRTFVQFRNDIESGKILLQRLSSVADFLMLNVHASQNENTQIIIYDIQGKEVLNLPMQLTMGNYQRVIDTSKLINGNYILKIIGNGYASTGMRFVKL